MAMTTEQSSNIPKETGIEEFKMYHANGQLSVHGYLLNGLGHGEHLVYNDKGILISTQTYCEGKEHGTFLLWHNKKITSQHHYQNGKLHGPYKIWHKGKLISEAIYRDGLKEWHVVYTDRQRQRIKLSK
jgi:antitoxin component YwqK of YwqJK toxin-antitoxin module